MKDVRFYLEFPSRTAKKRSGREHRGHSGNVFAAFDCMGNGRFYNPATGNMEGLGGIFEYADSPVGSTAASPAFLRQCKRIPEALARSIHPSLFERLDAEVTE